MKVELITPGDKRDWDEMQKATSHCRSIKALYKEVKSQGNRPKGGHTMIPRALWFAIEAMLEDADIGDDQ